MAYDPEAEVAKQYAQSRTVLKARQDVARQNAMEDLMKREAQTGGFGGAGAKMRRKALTEIDTGFAAEDANLGASQAKDVLGLKEAERTREFAASESEKQRQLAREQLAQQEKQFGATLDFQKGSFADQMQYSWAELDENKKTNLINAGIALKESGMTAEAWRNTFLNSPAMAWFRDYMVAAPGRFPGTDTVQGLTPQSTKYSPTFSRYSSVRR